MDNEILDTQEIKETAERIGFGPRLGAFLLDVLITLILGGLLGFILGGSLSFLIPNTEEYDTILNNLSTLPFNLLGMMGGFMLLFYGNILLEMITGSSIGKKILKLQIGDQDGKNCDVSTYLIRSLIKNISVPFSILYGITGITLFNTIGSTTSFAVLIGFFFILGAAKQGFHDKIAKTAVFNKEDLS